MLHRVSESVCSCNPIPAMNLLECVGFGLPSPVQLDAHLDASEDHLLSPSEVDPELHNIAIVDGERLGLGAWRAQPDVIEKGPGRALHVLDVPFALLVPELAVASTDDLALEAYGRGRGGVCRYRRVVLPLGVAADFDDLRASWQSPRNGRER